VPQGAIYRDKFIVLYNPLKPSESILGSSTPFFYSYDSFGITAGVIISERDVQPFTYKDKQCFFFRYEYVVNGEKYKRDQNSAFCNNLVFSILKKGMRFNVKYALNNPQSSVMILDTTNMNVLREIPCERIDSR
jgi:hypothetical protein